MTETDYLDRSASISERLTQVREQIYAHVGMTPRRADSLLIRPLLDRQQEIIDELIALESEFWNA